MRYLAVRALVLGQKIERGLGIGEVAFGIQRQRTPQRVAPKEPVEAGALGLAGRAVTRDQAGADERIGNDCLQQINACPIVRLPHFGIGHAHI